MLNATDLCIILAFASAYQCLSRIHLIYYQRYYTEHCLNVPLQHLWLVLISALVENEYECKVTSTLCI